MPVRFGPPLSTLATPLVDRGRVIRASVLRAGGLLAVAAALLAAGALSAVRLSDLDGRSHRVAGPAGVGARDRFGADRRDGRVAAITRRGDGALLARGGGLATTFDRSGPRVRARTGSLALRLAGVGRRGTLRTFPEVEPVVAHDSIVYRRSGLSEWYLNGRLGLEQGFTLSRRPAGRGDLLVAVEAAGTLVPRLVDQRVVFASRGRKSVLSYSGLAARDAGGRSLPATLRLVGRRLELRVDDRRARYPVVIDPLIRRGVAQAGTAVVEPLAVRRLARASSVRANGSGTDPAADSGAALDITPGGASSPTSATASSSGRTPRATTAPRRRGA